METHVGSLQMNWPSPTGTSNVIVPIRDKPTIGVGLPWGTLHLESQQKLLTICFTSLCELGCYRSKGCRRH